MRTPTYLILLLLMISTTNSAFMNVDLSAANTTINASSQYSFHLCPDSIILNTDTITITFPSQVVLQDGNRQCIASSSDNLIISINTCSSSANKLTVTIISNTVPVSRFIVSIQVLDGIKNPPSVFADFFSVEILDNAQTIKNYNYYSQMFFTPGTLKNVGLTSSSAVSGASSDLTISFIPKQTILSGGTIKVNLPCYNENSGSSSCISLIPSGGTTTLKINSGISSSSIMTISASYLTISNIFPNANSDTTSQISFTIQNILNPPSTAPLVGYVITTAKDEYSIEVSDSLSLRVTQPSTVSMFQVANPVASSVNQMRTLGFVFMTRDFKPAGAILELIFPDDLPISVYTLTAVTGISKLTRTINYSVNGQKVTMMNAISTYYISTSFHYFEISNIRNPSSTKPTGNFNFNVYTPDNYIMYSLEFPVSYAATAGQFSNLLISQLNKEINVLTSYTFSFTNQNAILPNSLLKVTFPPEAQITNFSQTACTGIISGISDLALCEVTSNSLLTISNGFSNGLDAYSQISFIFKDVTNFSCVKTSSSFSIASHTSSGYAIDLSDSGITVDFSEGSLINPEIKTESKANYALTTYTISFSNKNALPVDSQILINLPTGEEVVITDANLIQTSCKVTIGADTFTSNVCFADMTNQIITIKNFNPTNIIPPNTSITVSLPSIRNPRSLKETATFNIRTQTSTGYNIDKNSSNLKILNTISGTTTEVIITPSSFTTGATSTYEFSFTPGTKLINGDILTLTLPNQITGLSNSNVSVVANENLLDTFKYQIVNNIQGVYIINLTLAFSTVCGCITSSDKFAFQIKNLKNPSSLKPTDSFQMQFKTSESFDIERNQNSLQITMTTPNLLLETYVKAVTNQKNANSNYNIQMTPFNTIPKGGFIIMKYPSQITVVDGRCVSVTGLPEGIICENDANNREITLKEAFVGKDFTPTLIQFAIIGLKNEMSDNLNMTDSFQLFTQTSDGFQIDQKLNGLSITFNCPSPCATCLVDQKTCASCMEDSPFNLLHEGKCLTQCPTGNSSDGTKTNCYPCSPLCATCRQESKDQCLTCKDSLQFYLPSTFTCVNDCPDGFYGDSATKRCISCLAPCKTCSSSTRCLSCLPQSESNNFNLIYPAMNKCVAACPIGVTVLSINASACLDCDSSCLTCGKDINNCTACKENKVLYQNKCIDPSNCPLDSYADLKKKECLSCNPKCKICGDSYDTCKTCKEGFIMNSLSSCFDPTIECATGFYLNISTSYCQQCNNPCITCSFNGDFCTKCAQGLYLQNNRCVEKCSDGYFLQKSNSTLTDNAYECSPCLDTCKTCGGDKEQCTSCKENSYLYDSKCLGKCPDGFYADDAAKCSKCFLSNCELCDKENCLKCQKEFFLNSGKCYYQCPIGLQNDINTGTCITISEPGFSMEYPKTIKFSRSGLIFFFSSLLIIFVINYCKHRFDQTYFCACCISLISIINFLQILVYTYFAFISGIEIFFIGICSCITTKFVLNTIFVFSYDFYTNNDLEFFYWKSNQKIVSSLFLFYSYFIDYKIIRLFYSRFCLINFLTPKFQNYNRIHSPYRKVAMIEVIILTIPIILLSIYITYTSKPMSDLWWAAVENIMITSVLFLIILFDLYIHKDLNQDFYNQKKCLPDIIPYIGVYDRRVFPNYKIDKKFDFTDDTKTMKFTSIINSDKKEKRDTEKKRNAIRKSKSVEQLKMIKKLEHVEIAKYRDDTILERCSYKYYRNIFRIKLTSPLIKKTMNIIEKFSSNIKNFIHNLSNKTKNNYREFEDYDNEKTVKEFEPGLNTPSFNDLDKTDRSHLPFNNRIYK